MVCLKNTIMKKLLLPLVTLVLVVACSSSNNEELSVSRKVRHLIKLLSMFGTIKTQTLVKKI